MEGTVMSWVINLGLVLLGYFLRHKGITIPFLPGPPPTVTQQAVKALPTWLPAILAAAPWIAKFFPSLSGQAPSTPATPPPPPPVPPPPKAGG